MVLTKGPSGKDETFSEALLRFPVCTTKEMDSRVCSKKELGASIILEHEADMSKNRGRSLSLGPKGIVGTHIGEVVILYGSTGRF